MTNRRQHEAYRSRDEIIFEILTAVKNMEPKGIFLTRLMFLSRITNIQLKQYLNELLQNGLITVDSSKGYLVAPSLTDYRKAKGTTRRNDFYHITQKGLRYLTMVQEMQQKMGIKI